MTRTVTNAPPGDASRKPNRRTILRSPLCIIGSPRSGTTWLQRLLLSHPHACGGPESHFFEAFGPALRKFEWGAGQSRRVGLASYWQGEDLREAIGDLWARTMGPSLDAVPSARLLVEKTPGHALWVPEIRSLLPGARFVHLIRDSRAVVASLLAANRAAWGRGWAPSTVRDATRSWRLHVKRARAHADELGDDYTEVFYEDLKRDTAGELARLLKYAGLEADDKLVRHMVAQQDFDRLRAGRGEPVAAAGGVPAGPEPPGFFRRGQIDAWKQELSWPQRWAVWWRTRHLLRELGYAGR